MANSIILVTVTDVTTVLAPTATATIGSSLASIISSKQSQSSLLTSLASQSLSTFTTLPSPTHSSTPHSTGIPPLPSGFIPPAPPAKDDPGKTPLAKDDTLARFVLAAIILIVLLYILIISLACIHCWKGKKPNGDDERSQAKRMATGKLGLPINAQMVRDRENYISEKAQADRAAALRDLEGHGGAHRDDAGRDVGDTRDTIWPDWRKVFSLESLIGSGEDKGKERAVTPRPHTGLEHGDSSLSSLPQPGLISTSFLSFPASSIYSHQPFSTTGEGSIETFRNNRHITISNFEPDSRAGPSAMSRIATNDPDAQNYRNAAALAADPAYPDREDARKYAEQLMDTMQRRERDRRSRPYGGLPSPEMSENIQLGDNYPEVSEAAWTKRVKDAFGLDN